LGSETEEECSFQHPNADFDYYSDDHFDADIDSHSDADIDSNSDSHFDADFDSTLYRWFCGFDTVTYRR
jgi:hypothetical protein